ncbi:MAG: glycosyltransferase family 2 protein [Simkaniaceae bacterium]
MKRFFLILVLIAIGFTLGFSYREIKVKVLVNKMAVGSLKPIYATHPILKKAPFVVVIHAYNNASTCEQTLVSVLNQNYDPFRLIYIDGGSTDGSYEKVENVLSRHPFRDHTLLRPTKDQNVLEVFYRALHACQSHEIALLLEGKEFLAHENVLNELNHLYANPDVWVTEASALDYPTYEKRKNHSTLRTFYVGLFQKIKLQEFVQEGRFLTESKEKIIHAPLKGLAREHAFFTPNLFYLSGAKLLSPSEEVKALMAYAPHRDLPGHNFIRDDEHVDIVVFSYNRPLQLYAFLESANTYIKNLHRLYVIYRAENESYDEGYEQVKKDFPQVTYIKQSFEAPYEDFSPLVQKAVFDRQVSTARYVAFALDDNIVRDTIDMKEAVQLMKQTGAYGFYFRLGNHLDSPPQHTIPLQEGIFAWQFSTGKGAWACPNSVNMTLFRKEEIYPYFLCMKFHNPNILQALWNEHADLSQIGLYYERSKVVNLPLNIVSANEWINEKKTNISTKDLLTAFQQGLKMDIVPLKGLENSEIEINYEPQFIKREK